MAEYWLPLVHGAPIVIPHTEWNLVTGEKYLFPRTLVVEGSYHSAFGLAYGWSGGRDEDGQRTWEAQQLLDVDPEAELTRWRVIDADEAVAWMDCLDALSILSGGAFCPADLKKKEP